MSELLLSSSGGQPRQSLGARLTRAAVAAAGVALLVAGLILNVFMYFWLRNALEADVKVQSLVTADNVLAPLLFGDLRAARETLASLRAAPAIVSACLYDDKGRPFASYERSSGDVCDSLAVRQEVVLHGKHLHVASPVHQKEGGRTIGRVELVATLQPLMQRSLLFAGLTAIAGVAALGIAYLLAVGIRRDIDKTEARLDELAFVDPVTGLFNRRAAHEHLQSMVARGKPFGLMVLDLDDFKLVNDTLGHEAGDEVLRLLAKRLREGLRSTDLIFRLGGDEFIVVCDGHALEEGAERFGSVAIGALHKPLRIGINEIYARGSVGIAKFPDDAQDAQSLLRAADAAMYSAKAAGKNTFVVYRPEIGHETSSRLRIDTELRRAIGRGELVLYYQPIVDLRSGRAVGVEALVRWRHPERGLLPPSEFIDLAEQSGLIVEIGEWVLNSAARQLALWNDTGMEQLFVAVNVSGRQIKRGALVSQVSDALARAGADLRCLEIEITEHTLVEDVTANIATLTGLREQGMRIAVDDFGTGLSSLAYLKRLPIDKFKIDRSFVRELPYAAGDVAIVTAIISMARALGLQVVAEGVETDAQRELLARLGCDFAQGYLFGSPMPAHELDPLLRSRNVDWSRAGLASTSEVASNGDAGDVSGSDVCVVGGDTREVCPDAVSASGEEPSHPRCR